MENTKQCKISPSLYESVLWIKFTKFDQVSLEYVKKHFSTLPEFHAFLDEADEECDGAVCLIFNNYKPSNTSQIKKCKELNEQRSKAVLKEINKICPHLKLYFNIKRRTLTRLYV